MKKSSKPQSAFFNLRVFVILFAGAIGVMAGILSLSAFSSAVAQTKTNSGLQSSNNEVPLAKQMEIQRQQAASATDSVLNYSQGQLANQSPLRPVAPLQEAPNVVDCNNEPGIVIHDDATIENGYSGNPATINQVRFVDKFTPTSYPQTYRDVCMAFITTAGGPATYTVQIVAYADDGAGGSPGTQLGILANQTANIQTFSAGQPPVWNSFDISSMNLNITSGSVYIGAIWVPVGPPNVFAAADESTAHPVGFSGGYWWNNSANAWATIQSGFTAYRSLFVRAVEGPPPPLRIVAAGAVIQSEGCSPPNNVIDPGETVTVSFCVQNTGTQNSSNLVGTLQATGGVTNPGGPQSYGVVTSGGPAVCRSFTFTAGSALQCGGTLTATIQFQDGATDLGTVTYSFTLGTSVVAISENFDSVTPPALPANWTATNPVNVDSILWVTSNSGVPTPVADSTPNAAFVNDPSTRNDKVLVSPRITYSGPVEMRFRHNFALEPSGTTAAFDCGLLEFSTDDGVTFNDIILAGGTFVEGGYNRTTISTAFQNPCMQQYSPTTGAKPSWSGSSGGFITTRVAMPASGVGQNVRLRWRMCADTSVSSQGWRVDSVSISAPACCSGGAPAPASVVSRKTHGGAGTFDVPLPLSGSGVEPRTGGATNDYTIVASFGSPVTVTGAPQAQVISGIGLVGSNGVSNGGAVTISGNDVIIPLTNVTNAQVIQVRLNNVTSGASSGNVTIPMGVLVGDTNANRAVNSADVSQTKGRLGAPLDATNFRSDVNANGAINSADVSQIKTLLGTGLP